MTDVKVEPAEVVPEVAASTSGFTMPSFAVPCWLCGYANQFMKMVPYLVAAYFLF